VSRPRMVCLAFVLALAVVVPAASAQAAKPEPPKRVLIIILDQLRPDYIDTFDMTNVKALMEDGASFDNAYLGHMASETVISHNVITSGQLPRDMGWSDEAHRDVDGVLGPKNDMWISGSWSRTQFNDLIAHAGYPKLADYLHAAHPGTKFITAGQKNYAVYSANGPTGDISVTFSSRDSECDTDAVSNEWRHPTGFNVPTYLTSNCGRFYVDSSSASAFSYGTATTDPAWMYPLDQNRFAVGTDSAHYGGDVWTADAGMAMMEHENWSGMLLTLGSIDKMSHMWGGRTDTGTYTGDEQQAHLRFIAKTADDQVGHIIQKLRDLDQLDETLVVLTTDHAGQPAIHFNGVNAAGRSDNNWYYGATDNGTFNSPSPSLQPLLDTGNVRFSYQDSAIRTWLTDTSNPAKMEAAKAMATLPDVIASYRLSANGSRYQLEQANLGAMNSSERAWWEQHGQEIVDTMAAPWASDVVGLLHDDTSYGVKGDHGGAQKPVQEIPIVFYGAGVGSSDPKMPLRSVDILPTVLKAMGLPRGATLDGNAVPLPR
jgi:Type I phosphodiesterase / nucleotide pyrophosphatase